LSDPSAYASVYRELTFTKWVIYVARFSNPYTYYVGITNKPSDIVNLRQVVPPELIDPDRVYAEQTPPTKFEMFVYMSCEIPYTTVPTILDNTLLSYQMLAKQLCGLEKIQVVTIDKECHKVGTLGVMMRYVNSCNSSKDRSGNRTLAMLSSSPVIVPLRKPLPPKQPIRPEDNKTVIKAAQINRITDYEPSRTRVSFPKTKKEPFQDISNRKTDPTWDPNDPAFTYDGTNMARFYLGTTYDAREGVGI